MAEELMTIDETLKIIRSLRKDFRLIGAFPTSLDCLKDDEEVNARGLSILFSANTPGNHSQLSWIQSLRMDKLSDIYDDGLH